MALQACTECCGSNSLLGRNQLSHLRNDADCLLHWEGENLLLLKFVGKELIRNYEKALPQGLFYGVAFYAYSSLKEELAEHVAMLKKALSFISFNLYNNMRTPSWHLRGFLVREQKTLASLFANLRRDLEREKGNSPLLATWKRSTSPLGDEEENMGSFEIFNRYLNEINLLSTYHVDLLVLQHIYSVLDRETKRAKGETAPAEMQPPDQSESPVLSKRALGLLEKLFNLFALETIERDSHFFITEEFITPMQLKLIKFEIDGLCQEICGEDEKTVGELVGSLHISPLFWRHTFSN